MRFARRISVLALLAATGLVLFAPAASAADFGIRAGLYGGDGMIGVELLTPINDDWWFNPNVEYVFVDNGDLITVNGDAHYDFDTDGNYYLWAGGGLAVIFSDFDRPRPGRGSDSETDVGLNLLAGAGWNTGGAVRPYVQGKVTISDDTEAGLAVGVRF